MISLPLLYSIAAAVFAVNVFFGFGLWILFEATRPLRCVVAAFCFLICGYVLCALDLFVVIRAYDSHVLYVAHHISELFAIALLAWLLASGRSLCGSSAYFFLMLNVWWMLLAFGGACTPDIVTKYVMFGVAAMFWILCVCSAITCVRNLEFWISDPTLLHLPMISSLYTFFTLLYNIGILIGQPGVGILNTQWTAIWFVVSDILLYGLFGYVSILAYAFLYTDIHHHSSSTRPVEYGKNGMPEKQVFLDAWKEVNDL